MNRRGEDGDFLWCVSAERSLLHNHDLLPVPIDIDGPHLLGSSLAAHSLIWPRLRQLLYWMLKETSEAETALR